MQFIDNDEIVVIRPGGVELLTPAGEPIEREVETVDWDEETAEKGGYETFMLKEIHEQADAVAETIADRTLRGDGVDLAEAELDESLLHDVDRILILAAGTSFHAGLIGRYAIEEWARIPVDMDVASEWRYRNPIVSPRELVIGITQSGETADTLAAMRLARERGAKVLAVTNVVGSQATRDARRRALHARGPRGVGRRDEDVRLPGRRDVHARAAPRRAARDAASASASASSSPRSSSCRTASPSSSSRSTGRSRRAPSATPTRTSTSTSAATSAARSRSRAR